MNCRINISNRMGQHTIPLRRVWRRKVFRRKGHLEKLMATMTAQFKTPRFLSMGKLLRQNVRKKLSTSGQQKENISHEIAGIDSDMLRMAFVNVEHHIALCGHWRTIVS